VSYPVDVYLHNGASDDGVQILIPVVLFNRTGFEIVDACVASIRKFTTVPHTIWLIDNNSKPEYANWLKEMDGVNLALVRREPVNPFVVRTGVVASIFGHRRGSQRRDGSYANAIALEIGREVVPPGAGRLLTLHSDTLAVRSGWLSTLTRKMDEGYALVSGVRDNIRIGACHVSCLLVDRAQMGDVGASFLHNIRQERFGDRPEYDVGDELSYLFDLHQLKRFTFPNTHNDEGMIERIYPEDPLCAMSYCDRCLDDDGNVFFVHLGRGVGKALGVYSDPIKTLPRQWLDFAGSVLERSS
jgi:hypothetical protein